MFNVGWISSPAAVWRQGEDPGRRLRFPVPAYLIETDTERVLIDTGLHPQAARDPQDYYGLSMFELELERDIGEQIDLSTITRVVLTHLHFDHFPSFADDYEAQARSAERLRALRDAGVHVQPGHDPDVLRPGALAV